MSRKLKETDFLVSDCSRLILSNRELETTNMSISLAKLSHLFHIFTAVTVERLDYGSPVGTYHDSHKNLLEEKLRNRLVA